MTESHMSSYTSFDGHRRIATGTLEANAIAVKRALASANGFPVLIFDDATGRSIDLDLRGSDAELIARLAAAQVPLDDRAAPPKSAPARGRGRPKLGVVGREVTLLPRHWDWLGSQPGGASVALRKLVEQARRADDEPSRQRRAQERAYHFMSAIAGDLPGFEEACRALFANDRARFDACIGGWPDDLRQHACRLGFDAD